MIEHIADIFKNAVGMPTRRWFEHNCKRMY
jgi:hypothetical protein